MLWLEAQRSVSNGEKRLGCGSGAGHQQQGKSYLPGNQCAMSVAAARIPRKLRAVGLDQFTDRWV